MTSALMTKAASFIRTNMLARIPWRMQPVSQRFSIAVLRSNSLADLSMARAIKQPVLTRRHVTDVPAAFVADPFLCSQDDRWYMFFEVLNKEGWKGEIGLATSDDGVKWEYDRIVLRRDFHLSYPYVFQWDGDCYMLPESRQSGAATLYVAESFPYEWRPVADILSGTHIVDPSIFRHKDSWWLHTATKTDGGLPELRLFMASELTGSWREHPASPIVSGRYDIARPAGRVMVRDGRLIRFAQGLQPAYGTDVHVIEINHLCESRYQETYLGRGPILGPGLEGWNIGGMHHVDAHRLPDGGWLACVDGWSPVPRSLRNLISTMRYPVPTSN